MDTFGTRETALINEVSVLSGLILEKMLDCGTDKTVDNDKVPYKAGIDCSKIP